MRICIFSPEFPPKSIGGIERYLSDLIPNLIKRGFDVEVITESLSDEINIEKKDNLIIHRLPFVNVLSEEDQGTRGKKIFEYLNKLFEKRHFSLIEAEGMHREKIPTYTLAINMAALNAKIPLILRIHSFPEGELESYLIRDMFWDKILCGTKGLTEFIYDNIGVLLDKISTIYLFVDTEKFRPNLGRGWLRSRINVTDKDLIIMTAGRITGSRPLKYLELKGIIVLLKAFSLIAHKYKNARLLIAAAKPRLELKQNFEEAKKKIAELSKLYGIANQIKIMSFDLDEMPLVYNGADIFVMPSKLETFGLVYAEAMACGLPVIGTNVGGIPEVIDNKTGYLIPVDNHVALANKIEFLIKNKNLRKKLGEGGIKKVSSMFSLDKIMPKLLGVYNSVLHERKKNLKFGLDILKEIAEE